MDRPVFVLLGAAGGIGSALARRLRGSRLVLAGRTREPLEALAREVEGEVEVLDAAKFDEVDACLTSAAARHGRVDAVVSLPGSILLKPAHLTTEAELASVLQANVVTAFAAVRGAAKVMKDGGAVVLMSSAAARVGLGSHEAIAAAKAAVHGLTLSAAATYAARKLRVNCVAPGLVDTKLAARITGNEASRKASESMHPLGRIGNADEVAEAIEYLLKAPFVTGQILGVDGGLATVRAR